MRWTLGLLLAAATAGCSYPNTKMAACPQTGCGNQYATSSRQYQMEADQTGVEKGNRPAPDGQGPVPAESDLPPDRTPATEAIGAPPSTTPSSAGVLPDRPAVPTAQPPVTE